MARGYFVGLTTEELEIVRLALDQYEDDLIENCPDDVVALEKSVCLSRRLGSYQDVDAREITL